MKNGTCRARRRRMLRLVVRCGALAAAVSLLLFFSRRPSMAMVVTAASPLVMVCSAVALRSLGLATLIGLPVLIAVLLRRRWFCRWVCPMGLLTGWVGCVRRRKPRLRQVPPVGQWIAIVALAGACCGYPVLLWLDPLAIFSGFFGWWRVAPSAVEFWAGVGLPGVLILSLLWPGLWCRRLCPLGATQDLLGMGRVLRGSPTRNDTARPIVSPKWVLPRRGVLAAALGFGWGTWTRRVLRSDPARPIRPPGARDREQFSGLCVRCGNCLRACPTGILRPALGKQGLADLLTPVVRFEQGVGPSYCKEDCRRCTQVCPSGAIARLTLSQKRKAPMGRAVIDMDVCLVNEAECELCIHACPYEAISLAWDEQTYLATLSIDAAKCPGCGACQVVCPTSPTPAIVVVAARSV